jgi:hypothetical protein
LLIHCFLTIGWALFAAQLAQAQGNPRLTVFISDLHLGVGKKPAGAWHEYEDFRWAPEFALFLQEISRQGNGKTDLVIDGDTFELWQSLTADCIYPDASHQQKELGCHEEDALTRLRRVLASHGAELRAIGEFARSGHNQVVLIPGNHDAALLYEAIAREVIRAIRAPAGRVRVASEGHWISPDGLLYAEHGQQMEGDPDRIDGWPKPFIVQEGHRYLRRTWGEQFIQQYFNDFELKYPIIDNLSSEILGVRYGIAAEGSTAAAGDAGRFLRFYLTQASWQQLPANWIPGDKHADWDVKTIRAFGDEFLADPASPEDPIKAAGRQLLRKATSSILAGLSDDEIRQICDFRRSTIQAQVPQEPGATASTAPAGTVENIKRKLFGSREEVFRRHLEVTRAKLAQTDKVSGAFELFVYGHTHLEDKGISPFGGSGTTWTPLVVNSGAWQRTANPGQIQAILSAKGLTSEEALRKLQPEDLPACYSSVFVPPYATHPKSSLKYWRMSQNGKWTLADDCP